MFYLYIQLFLITYDFIGLILNLNIEILNSIIINSIIMILSITIYNSFLNYKNIKIDFQSELLLIYNILLSILTFIFYNSLCKFNDIIYILYITITLALVIIIFLSKKNHVK